MAPDPHHQRFFAYLSMFTFFMLLLVCGDNLLVMFIGWEGVGVTSYLLISFWYTRVQATKSALQAILVNRVGDWAFLIGLFGLFWLFGTLEYSTLFSIAPMIHEALFTLIALGLLVGAMAKSAQIGLHTWLPMAMEGSRILLPVLLRGICAYFLLGSTHLISITYCEELPFPRSSPSLPEVLRVPYSTSLTT
jgi:NADH-ubiquinone oxidoreductase chain 5